MPNVARIVAILEARDLASPTMVRFGNAVKTVGALAAAVGAVQIGRMLVGGIEEAVAAASEAEEVEQRLAKAIQNSGQSVTDVLPKLLGQASALQTVTGRNDEAIKSGQSLLISLGKLRGEGLERATKAALDLSAGTGKDLAESFQVVAKASAGNTTALQKLGIRIDENIPRSQRFGAALDQLDQRFGGQAVARMGTFAGRVELLNNRIGELKETVGRPFVEVFSEVLGTALNPFLKDLDDSINKSEQFRASVLLSSAAVAELAGQIADVAEPFAKFAIGAGVLSGLAVFGQQFAIIQTQSDKSRASLGKLSAEIDQVGRDLAALERAKPDLSTDEFNRQQIALEARRAALKDAIADQTTLGTRLRQSAQRLRDLAAEGKPAAGALVGTGDAADDAADSLSALNDALDAAGIKGGADQLTKQIHNVQEALEALSDAKPRLDPADFLSTERELQGKLGELQARLKLLGVPTKLKLEGEAAIAETAAVAGAAGVKLRNLKREAAELAVVWKELTDRRESIGEEQFAAGARAVSKLGAGIEALGESVSVPVSQLDRLNARLELIDAQPVRDLARAAVDLAHEWDAIADTGDVFPAGQIDARAREIGRLKAELKGLGQDVEIGFDLDTRLGTAAARAELEELAKTAGLSLRDVELDAQHLEDFWNAIQLSPLFTDQERAELSKAVAAAKVGLESLGEPVEIHLTGVGRLAELNEQLKAVGAEGFRDLQQEARALEAAWLATKAAFADGLLTPEQFRLSERGLDALRQEIERLGQGVDVGDLPAVNIPVHLQIEEAVAAFVQDGAPAIQDALDRIGAEGIEPLGETLDRVFRGQATDAAVSFGDALVDAAVDGEAAWDKFFKSLLKDIAKAIVRALVLRAIMAAVSGGASEAGGGVVTGALTAFAEGGKVTGGVPGKDSVPALLTPGEFVVNAPAAKRLGPQFLEAINTGRVPMGGAPGGRGVVVGAGGAGARGGAGGSGGPGGRGGPGGSVPALLTPGEFVVAAPAAHRLGKAFLEAVNTGRMPLHKLAAGGPVAHELLAPQPMPLMEHFARFAEGGVVGLPPMTKAVPNLSAPSTQAQSRGGARAMTINVDASIRDVAGLTDSQLRELLLRHPKDVADAVRDAMRLGL